MQKFLYYLGKIKLSVFVLLFVIVLVIGPVLHNHHWQITQPFHCPAFLLEQVLTSVVIYLVLGILIELITPFPVFGCDLSFLKEFQLILVQAKRPPPTAC